MSILVPGLVASVANLGSPSTLRVQLQIQEHNLHYVSPGALPFRLL